jgi:hypothetical protein
MNCKFILDARFRLDKAHGVCTVSHLRLSTDLQSGAAFAQSLVHCLSGGGSHCAALQHLALATISDYGLTAAGTLNSPVSNEIALTSLLSAPIGSSRSKYLRMLSSPDIERARRDARAATQFSQDLLRRAVSTACALADPHLTALLLAWLLRAERDVGDQVQVEEEGGESHNVELERMILMLPRIVLDDARLRAALQSSRCVRGALLSRLLQIHAGQTTWALAITEMRNRDILALFWLHVRSKWAAGQPV